MHGILAGANIRSTRIRVSHTRCGHTLEQLKAGLDENGRFIGPQDVSRGFRYFQDSRRHEAPIVHSPSSCTSSPSRNASPARPSS